MHCLSIVVYHKDTIAFSTGHFTCKHLILPYCQSFVLSSSPRYSNRIVFTCHSDTSLEKAFL